MDSKIAIRGLALVSALTVTAMSMGQGKMTMGHSMGMARYGGPVYNGKPALAVTASLLHAGGGAGNWSFVKAVTSIAGTKIANGEVAKLTRQYGKARVSRFVKVFDFAVADAVRIAAMKRVTFPIGTLTGKSLGAALVGAGQDKSGVFYTEYMLDKALSHAIHMQVMTDIDRKFGAAADKDYHRISNQAHYDLGRALGMKVKLAKLH